MVENIPEELKNVKQWVGLKKVWNEEREKYDKIPHNPLTGEKASSTDPETWASFDEAVSSSYDLIGIALSENDPYIGVDIDNQLDKELALSFGTYAEISPSGNGLRVIGKGTLPEKAKNRNANFEIYESKRFLSLTGNKISKNGPVDCQESINDFVERYIGFRESSQAEESEIEPEPLTSEDESAIEIRKVVNPTFKALFEGDTSNYQSPSEADFALACHLAESLGKRPGTIFQAMLNSGLVREKWQRSDYIAKTIYGALEQANLSADEFEDGITLNELQKMEFPEPKWAVKELIPEGLGIIAGRPKIGKSFWMLAVGKAVANGEKFLDSFECKKGRVLYITYEESPRLIRNRVSTMLGNQKWPQNFDVYTKWPQADEGGIEKLGRYLTKYPDTRLIVIDTWAKFRPKRNGSNKDMYSLDYQDVGAVKALADQKNVAILCVHHQNKSKPSDIMDTISGSTGLTGAADTMLVLHDKKRGQEEATATLTATGREIKEKDLALKFNESSLHWENLGDAQEVKVSNERQEIIELLQVADEDMKPSQVARELGKDSVNVRKLMNMMEKEGLVVKSGYGKYRAAYQIEDSEQENVPEQEESNEHIKEGLDGLL